MEVRYEIADRAEFALGANNVFDVYPDRRPVGPSVTGAPAYPVNFYFLPYTGFSPFGFNGRYVYGRMSVQF
jgi:iron complex outermembrane receptor protein